MTKYSHLLGICCALLLGGCQTVEQLSIDYMLPAEVSFPPSLKRVAVVNNMPSIPDNKLIVEETDEKKKDETEIARKTKYFNGNSKITTEHWLKHLPTKTISTKSLFAILCYGPMI